MTTKSSDGPVPIGREPVPKPVRHLSAFRGELASPSVAQLLPQVAAVDGTVLRVGARRCDLATARTVRVRTTEPLMDPGYPTEYDAAFLDAQQDAAQPPVILVIQYFGWNLCRPEHLRLLAGIIGERDWKPGDARERAMYAATFLSDLAGRIDRDNQVRSWNFRAGPLADRRESPGEYRQMP